MSTLMTQTNLPPTGLNAHFFGQSVTVDGSTFYYWVQAQMPDGSWTPLSGSVEIQNCPASFDHFQFALVKWNPTPGAINYNLFRTTTATMPQSNANLVYQGSAPNFTDRGNPAFNATQYVVPGGNLRVAQARFDNTVDTQGAAGGMVLTNSDVIPNGALLVAIIVAPAETAIVGPTDIELGTSAGSSATALLGSTALATFNAGLAELITPPVQMSAAGSVKLTSTVAAVSAGLVDIFVAYLLCP